MTTEKCHITKVRFCLIWENFFSILFYSFIFQMRMEYSLRVEDYLEVSLPQDSYDKADAGTVIFVNICVCALRLWTAVKGRRFLKGIKLRWAVTRLLLFNKTLRSCFCSTSLFIFSADWQVLKCSRKKINMWNGCEKMFFVVNVSQNLVVVCS